MSDDDDWRTKWLVLPSWGRLHRVAEIEWANEERIAGEGITVCGHRGELRMPGIFSRMGRKRCVKCCYMLGVPNGDGAPFNDESLSEKERAA